jgi:hypothetical protein
MDVDARLARAIAALAGEAIDRRVSGVSGLWGGGSTRLFVRVDLEGGGSVVAMHAPRGTDEWGHASFVELRGLLESRGIRVPRLLGASHSEGLILVEDLGDDTLARHVERHPSAREALYRAAAVDLARAQSSLAELPEQSLARRRAFDRALLEREIDHFREWALDARGVTLSGDERAGFASAARWLAGFIADWPRGFVHRDYQSRNLMVETTPAGPRLAWIDFQDALQGPRVYDLVALLADSYQSLEPEFVQARLDEYAVAAGVAAPERLRFEFDLVTVQRKLKDAGRFIYFDRVTQNPSFLPFVEPSVRRVRRALERLGGISELEPLAAGLARWFP